MSSQPNPNVWPACSECDIAYVLRRMLSLSEGWLWLWQRDCGHKKAEAVVVTNDVAVMESFVDAVVGPEGEL